ncbi:hypothetical protein CJ255_11970 [Candidatus Viridilinea mediisalina]|uniref:Uncharacterized protein n=1 Tax=Candidatus Viridilinea mediisalina TaxID=2024553 RepID=A0A2A6RIE7_9CHLR|nr:hypothetical protein CJ255_11970 [Candidatus Viridilinea mediisalina]
MHLTWQVGRVQPLVVPKEPSAPHLLGLMGRCHLRPAKCAPLGLWDYAWRLHGAHLAGRLSAFHEKTLDTASKASQKLYT